MKSRRFLELWLDAPAMKPGDMQRAIALLQAGIATPEHQAFVESLSGR